MKRDFYDDIGVERDITPQALKRLYRKLARELHPDVNPSEEAAKRFALITAAYDTLSDPDKRREYDIELAAQEAHGSQNREEPQHVKSTPLWQVASWPWQDGVAEGDVPITRIPVSGENEAWEKIRILEECGMQPVSHESRFMGPTVRLSGVDVERIRQAQWELGRVAQWPWQPAKTEGNEHIMRVPVSDPAQIQAVMGALEWLGMTPYLQHSQTLGQTVRIKGEDMQGIRVEQQRQAFKNGAMSDIVKWGWHTVQTGPMHSFEISVNNLAEAQQKIRTLQAAGMNGEESFIEGKGMSVRLTSGRETFMPAWAQFTMANPPPSSPPPSNNPPPSSPPPSGGWFRRHGFRSR